MKRIRGLWRNLIHRTRVERELDEEVRARFDVLEEENRQKGMSPDAARRAAMVQLGRIDSIKAWSSPFARPSLAPIRA